MCDRAIRALPEVVFCADILQFRRTDAVSPKRRMMTVFISTMGATTASGMPRLISQCEL